MEREEKDRKLKKNEVFRRNKKCISQESNKHCHSDNGGSTPCKILKLESHSSTESDTENTINKSFSVSNNFYLLLLIEIMLMFNCAI